MAKKGEEDLIAKFRDCASHSIKPLPTSVVNKIIKTVDNLEELEDVSEMIRLVS